jgi:hypothetical protein
MLQKIDCAKKTALGRSRTTLHPQHHDTTTRKQKKNSKPDAGVEPATLRLDQSPSEKVKLRVSRSTD